MRSQFVRACGGAAALALAAGAPLQAGAETLADAIALAYQTNPGLQQQRAELRGLDESHVQATAGLRPTITAQVVGQYQSLRYGAGDLANSRTYNPSPATRSETNALQGQVVLNQPIFTGGRVSAAIRQADEQIAAGRQSLRSGEGDLLLNVIDAYTSVRRDLAGLNVRRTSVSSLERQLKEAKARRQAGDATQTDIAQAEAQLESERALYASAAQQLEQSRTTYETLVGRPPGDLQPEPELPNLPSAVDKAFDRAETSNPELRQAVLTETASRAAIVAARAANRPTLSLQGSYGYNGVASPLYGKDLERQLTAEAVLTQPFYAGGVNSSNIRKAIDQNEADRIGVEVARRAMIQNVANAWNGMITARQNLQTQTRQVNAQNATYTGMQTEYRAGLRSSFDVLYAEEVLRTAEIAQISAAHDAYVESAAVLRYIGDLEVATLSSTTPTYDTTRNLRHINRVSSLPFDPLLQHLDRVGSPSSSQTPLTAPPQPRLRPRIRSFTGSEPKPEFATQLPRTPRPGTTADGTVPSRNPDAPIETDPYGKMSAPDASTPRRATAAEDDPIGALIAKALAGDVG